MAEKENWYSNKELFEQINSLKHEMQETKHQIQKYNGLREDLGGVMERMRGVEDEVTVIKQQKKTKDSMSDGFLKWGGWIVAVLSLTTNFARYFL